ncbi:unnamed protein product [Didymodactylos carnosus]|uniref:Fe2OG dioxygenase domain-containing protein n=1 Tax=Didymodactylos carnosus TaxID=1234261 RepID=A0A8S2DQY7_9BILA|nr:unnamed protein product [Didymodactylos carnosus]CAF3727665.1 unnamed protein product [Didymodactylos carnosus]
MSVVQNGIVQQCINLPTEKDKDKLAFLLYNVFTKDECQLIDMSEKEGYKPALVNVGFGQEMLMPDFRNNDRCIIDSIDLADKIYQRIESYIPKEWNINGSTYKVVGLNERLRFLRYDPGQKFEAHMDGEFRRMDDTEERSYITIQLYLNGGFSGGETTFLDKHNINNSFPCIPQTGMVLVFEHRLLHEGSALKDGRKYVIRTDVMYKPKNRLAFTQNTV